MTRLACPGRASSSSNSYPSKNLLHHSTTVERLKTVLTVHSLHPSIHFHSLQLPPLLKIGSLLVVPSYLPACSIVDDNLCDHLLFGVQPHCCYATSSVVHASVSLPIDDAAIHAVT
ncbi:hypothetical protein AVEN_211785-1 [Araneus ventricosus]|uniref:Uncharacterized protein n=1 Tax=Araneus ventricosus TaxID=182803 RepID=A0A4Y2N8S6_ARAVE|nr:hypothetical protein AVEN_4737-1 [Araneus ventricosus]GBN35050.1 hypothetical protein AVEN_211785-1 [Araneus ventricosus]